jgi:beta-lactamase class A
MRGFSSARRARLARVALAVTAVTAVAGLLSASGGRAGAANVASTTGALSGPAAVASKTSAGQRAADPLIGVSDYLASRQGVAQVALYNRLTGRTYLLSRGPEPQYTASIVKADILAMWLRRYQSRPRPIPDSIPYSIQYLMKNMITVSDNVAATSLFYFGGGCAALTAFNTRIPTRDTRVGCQTPTYYGWGNTTTTAADQVGIVATLAYPNRVLTPAARAYGLGLMESVIPGQRWGVSCGPWGTACDAPDYASPVPGVTVALKNGWKFVPSCTRQDDSCPWQVNSIGWVRGEGRDYALAVLTTDDPIGPGTYGFDYGITTIQGVSQLVWDNLAP